MTSPSTTTRTFRHVALMGVFVLLAVACGQKPGVHVEGAGGDVIAQPGGVDSTTGDFTDTSTTGGTTDTSTTGDTTSGTTGGFTTGGTTGGTGGGTTGGSTGGGTTGGGATTGGGSTGGGATTGGATTGGATGGGSTGGSGGAQVQGRDSTGVTDAKIVVGIHAPVTGAAPVPADEFRDNQNLYWDYYASKGKKWVGRDVEVIFEDDKYNPGDAKQKCTQLAANAFILVGGAGTDQIVACAELADKRGVPYFSAGVTQKGLDALPHYFAASMTYAAQADLLVSYILKTFGNKKTAMVVTNTPNFQDAWEAFEKAAAAKGLDYYKTMKHEKGDNSWQSSFPVELSTNQVEIVYPLTAPTDWINMASQAQSQGYNPQWAGVGITMGLNKILGVACRSASQNVDGAQFFSPYPELDAIDQMDPDFRKAAQELGVAPTDIGITLWGINKTLAQFLDRYEQQFGAGAKMTREQFRAFTETVTGVKTGVFPDLSYAPNNHFGANQVHVLQADCASAQYKTKATFKSAF